MPWFTDDGSKIVYLDPWKGQLVERVNDGRFSSKSGTGKIGFRLLQLTRAAAHEHISMKRESKGFDGLW